MIQANGLTSQLYQQYQVWKSGSELARSEQRLMDLCTSGRASSGTGHLPAALETVTQLATCSQSGTHRELSVAVEHVISRRTVQNMQLTSVEPGIM